MFGHYFTIRQHLSGLFAAPVPPPSRQFSLSVADARLGHVRLTGRFSEVPDASELLVLVHGLGGSSQSTYLFGMAELAWRSGISCLRLNLRGADLLGEDFFHAGLSQDIAAVLGCDLLQRYARRYLIGYSIGGHVCLKYAADYPPGNYPKGKATAVVAISPPLDLDVGAAEFDQLSYWPYRRHILHGLVAMYRETVRRHRSTQISVAQAEKIRRIRDWDTAIVAPRFGFASAEEYYANASVATVLGSIETSTLVLQGRQDPIVPYRSVEPWTHRLPPAVTWCDIQAGGHVGFAATLDLGEPAPFGLEPQVLSWLQRQVLAA